MTSTVTKRQARAHLSPAHRAVLEHLLHLLAVGEQASISNAYLAQQLGYSEGYISVIIRQLAGEAVSMAKRADTETARYATPFIRLTKNQKGENVITLLPRAEVEVL